MGKQYSADVIPEWRATLPGGRWVAAIEDISDENATATGKYQIKTILRTVEPMDGLPHFENFVIGTENDPNADDPDSWKGPAGQRYVQMLRKAGVEPSGDTESDFATVLGQQVGLVITQRVEPAIDRNGQPNQYAGQVRSQADTFFRVGERETGLDGASTDGAAARPAARVARPVGRPPAQPAAQQPAARPVGRPPLARPAVQPVQSARPVAPPPRASAPMAQAPKPKTMKCTICNSMVDRNVFADHVEAHEKAQAEGDE